MIYGSNESNLQHHQIGPKEILNMCCHRAKENVYNVGNAAAWMLEFMAAANDLYLPNAATEVKALLDSFIKKLWCPKIYYLPLATSYFLSATLYFLLFTCGLT